MSGAPTAADQLKLTANTHDLFINAGKMIDQMMMSDKQSLDLADLFRGPTPDQNVRNTTGTVEEFLQAYQMPLPEYLLEQIDRLECRCFMGVLPEISRAWMTVDNRLFLWDYINGGEIYTYEDQDQIICNVGIVKPKRSTPRPSPRQKDPPPVDALGRGEIYKYEDQDQFIRNDSAVKPKHSTPRPLPGQKDTPPVDFADYIMVITTSVQIILLAVTVTREAGVNTMAMFGTDMSVSSDDVRMIKICGTDNARIFMLGDNGHVYELLYPQSTTWFQSRCKLKCLTDGGIAPFLPTVFRWGAGAPVKSITIDNERNVLYMLSDKSSIQYIDLGQDGTQTILGPKCTDVHISARPMCHHFSTRYDETDFEVSELHIVPKAESKKIHLVGITVSGFRLYFTYHRDGLRLQNMDVNARPNALEMVRLRLPPRDMGPATTGNAVPLTPGNAGTATFGRAGAATPLGQTSSRCCYASYYGCGVMFAARSVGDKDTIATVATDVDIATDEQPRNDFFGSSQRKTFMETQATIEADGKVYAIAEVTESKENHDLREITKQLTNPSRLFLVLTNKSITIYSKQRPVDILYQLLLKAQHDPKAYTQEFAAFFDHYGQVQSCAMCMSIVCAAFASSVPDQDLLIKGAAKLFFDGGGSPSAIQTPLTGNHLGKVMNRINVKYSGRHDAFVLYFARLVDKIWRIKVFESIQTKSQVANYTKMQSMFLDAQSQLQKLRAFLDANNPFHVKADIMDARFSTADVSELRVLLAEQQSVNDMYSLLVQCMEAITFVDFIIDAGPQEIFQCVPDVLKDKLLELTLEDMLTTPRGRMLTRELVVATIRKFGASYSHVEFDAVSDWLRRRCSSFFGPSDMVFYKAIENLRHASKAETGQERMSMLSESVKLFKEATDFLTDDKLGDICAEYRRLCYHTGAIELALDRANRVDPEFQGLFYLDSTTPSSDTRLPFYETRLRCYEHVFQTLQDAKDLRKNPNKIPAGITVADPDVYYTQVFSVALASPDKLFHYVLYNWLLRNGKWATLMTVDTEHFLPFFKKYVDRIETIEFLWQYYRHREQYYEAALYLDMLAHEAPAIELKKRLEYLSLAVVNARCRDPKRQRRQECTQLLQQLEGRVLVARAQGRIHRILESRSDLEATKAAAELGSRLMELDDIVEHYARPFDLMDDIRFYFKNKY